MKRSSKSMLGVTLLEIMLVLAIAAMVIVMSIRYYQSASTNQKINVTLNNLTGIIAAGESYLAANGTFDTISSTALQPYLPGNSMPNSGWGGAMSVDKISATSYRISMPAPPTPDCTRLKALITTNQKVTAAADCSTFTIQ